MGKRRKRELIARFDRAMAEGQRWHERQMSGEDPDESRVSMLVGPPSIGFPSMRRLVEREVLRARTPAQIEHARVLLDEWLTLFDDPVMETYYAFLSRMAGAWLFQP